MDNNLIRSIPYKCDCKDTAISLLQQCRADGKKETDKPSNSPARVWKNHKNRKPAPEFLETQVPRIGCVCSGRSVGREGQIRK